MSLERHIENNICSMGYLEYSRCPFVRVSDCNGCPYDRRKVREDKPKKKKKRWILF